jgi:predicted nucleic acid-binding protein
MSDPALISVAERDVPVLLVKLGDLIRQARQRALRAVDAVHVQTCWELGRHIVEFEQGGAARAVYGKRLYLNWQRH